MCEIKIQNVIASFKLKNKINLKKIYLENKNISTYDEAVFNYNVVVMRINEPKMTFLIYHTGTVICTGAKSVEDANKSFDIFKEKTRNTITEFQLEKKLKIYNIVSTYDAKREFELVNVSQLLNDQNVEYEPEQFPGLIYRSIIPKGTALIFQNGKMVVSGAKSMEDIKNIIKKIESKLN